MAFLLTYYCPHIMALAFLVFFLAIDVPEKGRFFWRALAAVTIATVLAHLNRWFDLWPAHPYFASGHMTFCLGVTLSVALLRPWSLVITLPVLVALGVALVELHFHRVGDVLGAIPLVLVVYAIVHGMWRIAPALPPLDRAAVSP